MPVPTILTVACGANMKKRASLTDPLIVRSCLPHSFGLAWSYGQAAPKKETSVVLPTNSEQAAFLQCLRVPLVGDWVITLPAVGK